MTMSDSECDLDILTSLLNDAQEETQPLAASGDGLDDDLDLDELAAMMDDEEGEMDQLSAVNNLSADVDSLSADGVSASSNARNLSQSAQDSNVSKASSADLSAADLGLEMSDEEPEENVIVAPAKNKKKGSFCEAISGVYNKFDKSVNSAGTSKKQSNKNIDTHENSDVDPLEKELRAMEEKMNKIKSELAKKKKFNLKNSDCTSKRFTKLTNPAEVTEKIKLLTPEEKHRILERLKRNKSSVVHAGDTDSEDEEDNRNPFETQYNSYGRALKKQLEEKNNSTYSSRTQYTNAGPSGRNAGSPSIDLQSLADKKAAVLNKIQQDKSSGGSWQGVAGSLVGLKEGAASSMTHAERNAVKDPYSGLYIV